MLHQRPRVRNRRHRAERQELHGGLPARRRDDLRTAREQVAAPGIRRDRHHAQRERRAERRDGLGHLPRPVQRRHLVLSDHEAQHLRTREPGSGDLRGELLVRRAGLAVRRQRERVQTQRLEPGRAHRPAAPRSRPASAPPRTART
ncbi:hypothetical protein ACU686_41055 [Yinghuangia aomiensis]